MCVFILFIFGFLWRLTDWSRRLSRWTIFIISVMLKHNGQANWRNNWHSKVFIGPLKWARLVKGKCPSGDIVAVYCVLSCIYSILNTYFHYWPFSVEHYMFMPIGDTFNSTSDRCQCDVVVCDSIVLFNIIGQLYRNQHIEVYWISRTKAVNPTDARGLAS